MPEQLPEIAQKGPYEVEVEAGKTYFWCACGRSRNQPFCDGSHKGGPFIPIKYVAEADGMEYFCGCKCSGSTPLCDGTQAILPCTALLTARSAREQRSDRLPPPPDPARQPDGRWCPGEGRAGGRQGPTVFPRSAACPVAPGWRSIRPG